MQRSPFTQCIATSGRVLNMPKYARLIILVITCAITLIANAQYRASIRGNITDTSGAVIPGAKVTLINADTGQQLISTSDGNGIYNFNALPPAHFSMRVEKDGFATKELAQVQIIPEQLNSIDVQLEAAGTQTTVTVSGTTRGLDSETATVSSTISSNQIEHLPSFNRDVFQLAQLTPGVFGDSSQAGGGGAFTLPGNQGPGGTAGGSGGIFQTENGPQIQTRGGQYETNSVTVDGISTVSAVWGGTSVITPSEDSVDSLKVTSNSYDAENGRFSGAQIQVTSKSGTNNFHGSAFFKASRPGLNAYQRWNGPGSNVAGDAATRGVNRDNNRFNQYGGSLGGPIWRNRLFAFFNWETSPLDALNTTQGWYETSQFDSLAGIEPIATQYLTFPGNAVAASGIIQRTCASIGLQEGVNCNTTGQGLDIGSPLTTGVGHQDLTYGGNTLQPGIGGGLDHVADLAYYNTLNPTSTTQSQYNGRLDAQITQNDHVSFAIYWVPVSTTNFQGPVRTANYWHHSQVNDAFSVIWNHTFSPTLLNQARANAAGWRWNEVSTNSQAAFGLPQATIDAIGNIANNNGFQYFGAPGPSDLNQWTYSYNDVLTKIIGRHSIKIGGELTRLYYLNNPVYSARPQFFFNNLWDFANDAPYKETGFFDSSTGVPFSNRQDDRENIWGAFVQDDFKVLPNLTLNLGLRWSYFGSLYAKQDNMDVFRFGSDRADPLSGINIRVGGNLYNPQKNNWGPQFGFAWLPKQSNGNLVVRGGFGINYNQNEIAITANVNSNPPNGVNANFICAYPYTTNPTCAGTGILYETASDPHSIFGYAPNPNAVTTFGSDNLPTRGSPISVTAFEGSPKTITNYHYSLDTQYQFPWDIVATLGYQGSLTRHLYVQNNWNAVAAARGLPLDPRIQSIDFYDNAGNGNFNAMIATLAHNFNHGFQAQVQYTWAKAMDENSGPYSEDFYPYDIHAAYGRSDYNVQDAVKIFGLWQPVFFRGEHSWIEKIAGGWSLSGIWNWHTGFPWNPVYNTDGNTYFSGSGYSQLRPSAVLQGYGKNTGNKVFESQNSNFGGDGTTFFLPPTYVQGAPFPATSPAPAPGIKRNVLNGPNYNDVDASLTKAFGLPKMPILGENAKFEVRADTYNLFNKTNIDTTSIDNILGTVHADGTVSPNSSFGIASRALASRTVQLQARFSF